MQQLYLTGKYASALADRLFTALNVRPAGYRLQPFSVGGGVRGEALHLLLPPSPPMENDVPCRIRLHASAWAVVPAVLDDIAAPSLRSAMAVHAPMLLDGLTAPMLACPAFRESIRHCLLNDRAAVAVVREDAEPLLRALTDPAQQLWLAVPDDPEQREALLESLVTEAALRL